LLKNIRQNIKHSKSNFNEKKIKVIFQKKILCYEKLPKFEQHFELVSRTVTLNLLTRKSTDKNTPWKNANFLIIYLNKTVRLPW
jgi:hypothetical protein